MLTQISQPSENNGQSAEKEQETDKPVKSKSQRASSAPKPRNPRDHPMVKVVGRTRAIISTVKKTQNCKTFTDPDTKELGSKLLEQMKKRQEKLEKSRDMQAFQNASTDAKLTEYLTNNPVQKPVDIENPLEQYDAMREVLKEKNNDSLFDHIDDQDEYHAF